ncbi:MAG: DtxR family transcriptional regulator [Deltaproteobacteria bacterium]|nr:DtxR family transcriptional regulator [Deltaproteobacteria bacterium]
MVASDTVSASMEDYLEAIFHVIAKQQVARPKDIAKLLNVSHPSVTGALRALAEKELINYTPYDLITLTTRGEAAAKDVVRRHETLRNFFVKVLVVNEKEADEAACKMEHSIPPVILERFVQFAEFVEVCPRGGEKWVAGFGYYCDHAGKRDNCERCISLCLDEVKEKKEQGDQEEMNRVQLKDLPPGRKGRVVKVTIAGDTGKRMVEMGVTAGSLIEVERVAPLGDPLEVKVKGYHLSLRKEEAAGIEVALL